MPLVQESSAGLSPFAVQAARRVTRNAPRAEDVDWPQRGSGGLLERPQPSPIVSLNRRSR
jgi:predicted RNA polymerase sigma factor